MSENESARSVEERLAAARSWAQGLQASVAQPPEAPRPPAPILRPEEPRAETERLRTAIGSVERAAAAIRADAEEQARRHLLEAQEKADRMTADRVRALSELTDDLIEHARIVREHSERMVLALERAISDVNGKLAELGEAGTSSAAPAARDRSGRPDSQPSAEVLLRATRLAMEGEDRDRIAERLRAELGIDPEPVMRQIL